HAAAADFLQNFVMTKVPLLVGHVRFREDAFERLAGRFTFGFKSFAQETVDAGSMIKLRCGAAVRAFRRMLDYIREGSRRPGCFVHQAARARAAHKNRITSSTSPAL